ncbi:MAG: DUF3551 domain-containing protein [Verrucomicrobia bacterium]|nr:DUF3551 domain-containing protein [Verrucomicrobiota bacterium]
MAVTIHLEDKPGRSSFDAPSSTHKAVTCDQCVTSASGTDAYCDINPVYGYFAPETQPRWPLGGKPLPHAVLPAQLAQKEKPESRGGVQ